SGLSPHCLHLLERLHIKDRFAKNAVHMPKLLARGPDGLEVFLNGQKGAWVVPRVDFDHGIVRAATEHGVKFQDDTKVVELLRNGEVRGVKTNQGDIEADFVVCANGSPSRFSRETREPYAIRTIMGWWKGSALPSDQGIMAWDRRLDGYYAWAFPEPDGVANYGITIPEGSPHASRLKELFQEVLDEQFGELLRGAEQVGKWMGHPATLTTTVGDVVERRAMWIGEAARLVSPATVEGISFAMESGIVAAETIAKHFDRERGMSKVGAAVYRAKVGSSMLPKFIIAEGFVRLMRSPRAREWSARVLNPQWLASKASTLVGERPA
ncbi:MAG TPA: NAD(P)/FAD-dependent oxidoreductase, partial [Nannocystaceae bacterium]|nr:NAD(P)/FAD-dependent oxidoreductase [Nannocystaceae bacterium]